MISPTILAVLLVGDPTAVPPKATSPPATVEVSLGWNLTKQVDPFSRTGPQSFSTQAPVVGARLRGQKWYFELAGQMMHTSLTNRNIVASVSRDVFAVRSVRFGLNAEFNEIRFRRDDFRSGDVDVATNRTATSETFGISMGIGPFRDTSVRLTPLIGWYQNRYGSVVTLPGFTGDESLSDDELPLAGAKFAVEGVTFANRIEVGGSVRYLRLIGNHAAQIPDTEISGTATLNIRLFAIRKKSLYIGAYARFGPSQASIVTDKTFGLRGIWKLR